MTGPRPPVARALLRGAPALLLAAGCFSEPPYEPETGVVFAPSAAGAAAGGGVVTGRGPGPAFALRFADTPSFHFPDSLVVDGDEVLGHEVNPGCFRENQLGFLIAPVARIDASSSAPVTQNVLTPVLRGPAVAQVKLEWGTSFACNPARTPGGTSTYTVFPDGKVVRIDKISDPVASEINATQCACAEPQSPEEGVFHSLIYWSVARERVNAIFVPDFSQDPQTVPDAGESRSAFGNQSIACAQREGTHVAFAWSDFINTNIRGGGALLGFEHELGTGPSELAAISFEDRSAMFLERTQCQKAIERATAYLMPPKLKINGDDVAPAKLDGIYGGDPGSGGAPGIPLAGDRAELSGAMPAGFAVWLRFSRSVEGIRTTITGAPPAGEWFLPQRVDDTSWIVWFRDALGATQTITVEAR